MTNENPALQLADELEDFAKDVWDRFPETIRQNVVDYKKTGKKTRQEIVNTLQGDILKRRITLSGICQGEDLEDTLFDLNWENRADEQKDLRTWIRIVSTEFEHHFPLNKNELARRLESGKFFCTGQNWWNSRRLVNKAIRLLRNIARNQEKNRQVETTIEGEWSKPMTKSQMMRALGLDSYKKLKTFSKTHPIREAGSKKSWQIRLDGLNKEQIEKLTKA